MSDSTDPTQATNIKTLADIPSTVATTKSAAVETVQEEEAVKPVSVYPEGLNFLTDYVFYNSNNEAPKLFHIMSALSILSTAISRKVYIKQGYFTFYCNLYVVMVGDPGGGKSTALDVAKAFIRKLNNVPLAADAMTTQALLRYMSEEGSPCKKNTKVPGEGIVEYTPITIFAGELISFIGMDPYGWITFLTTVYHEEVHEVKTKNKGDDLIKGPYVCLLGCMTPDTTANLLQQRIISSGMARRTIFVWGEGRGEPQPFPEISEQQKAALERCFKWAVYLSKNVKGEFKWTQEARDFYGPWYIDLRKNIRKYSTPTTAGYFESKHVQLLKLTMLVSLTKSDELLITKESMLLALEILESAEKDMHKVFEGQGRNQEASVSNKILNLIETSDVPPRQKVIYNMFYNDANREELDRIVHHLIESGKLCRVEPIIQDPTGKKVQLPPYLCTPSQKKHLNRLLQEQVGPSDAPEPPPSDELDLGTDLNEQP